MSALLVEEDEYACLGCDIRLHEVPDLPRGTSARLLMLPGHLNDLFERKPHLRGTRAAKIAESIRDAVVMNA